jgi:hypothetical protein
VLVTVTCVRKGTGAVWMVVRTPVTTTLAPGGTPSVAPGPATCFTTAAELSAALGRPLTQSGNAVTVGATTVCGWKDPASATSVLTTVSDQAFATGITNCVARPDLGVGHCANLQSGGITLGVVNAKGSVFAAVTSSPGEAVVVPLSGVLDAMSSRRP